MMRIREIKRLLFVTAVLFVLVGIGGPASLAQGGRQGTTAPTDPHNLSGFWELRFDSKNVPDASLTPAAQKAEKEMRAKDLLAIRWCNFLGMPFIMGDYGRLDIRQGKIEMAIVPESMAPARHIYIDGRPHTNPDAWDPNTSGESIGHWEGDTFVVDTIGFSDKGVTAIPGGGYRTEKSHLVERYRLWDDQRMEVQFTWEDPGVFAKPHTYEFLYYKAPPGAFAQTEATCDPFDQRRISFLMNPPAIEKPKSTSR